MNSIEIHEAALERLAPYGPEWGPGLGFTNHGPMATESLITLGYPEHVEALLDLYVPDLQPMPTRGPYAESYARQRAALHDDWRGAVAAVATLAAADAWAALGHGVIRIGHAIRALEIVDTPLRRDELARALAHWESRAVPRALAAPTRDAHDELDELAQRAAIGFASVPAEDTFVRLHTITTTVNARRIVDVLEPELAARVAASVRASLEHLVAAETTPADQAVSPDLADLVAEAVASRDVHEVKLADGLMQELGRAPGDPALIAAAARQARMLGLVDSEACA